MNKVLVLIIISILFLSYAHYLPGVLTASGPPVVEWNKTYGTTRTSPNTMWSGISAIQTRDNGFAAVSTSDFGTGNEVDWRFWLVKTDSTGNAEWNKTYGEQSALASSIVQTIDGGYAMAGCYHIGGYPSALLVKTDPNGSIEWSKNYSEMGWAMAYNMIQTTDGGYVIAGSKEYYDGWLMKTDANGTMQWSRSFVEVNNTQLQSARALFCIWLTTDRTA